jgi:hypothetical protein
MRPRVAATGETASRRKKADTMVAIPRTEVRMNITYYVTFIWDDAKVGRGRLPSETPVIRAAATRGNDT